MYGDNNFLAKWLSDELTVEEKAMFEKSEDYRKYVKIINCVDTLDTPTYNKEKLFLAIQQGIEKETKSDRSSFKWVYSAAAAVLLIIGLFFFLDTSVKQTTNFGEKSSLVLPDGSEVFLNAKSSVKFKKSDWNTERKVVLTGEAFFKVKKGSDFWIETPSGEVFVLGTHFNVNSRKNFFEVVCYTGKVKVVVDNQKETILTRQKAYRVVDAIGKGWDIKKSEPSWLSGETTFTETPIKLVIQSIENQFDVSFEKGNIDENQLFTGSYNHNDIELALKTVFAPMEISYHFKNKNSITLTRE